MDGLLSLFAHSRQELLSKLAATDIAVPLASEGRKKHHRERYTMAHLLAAIAGEQSSSYPLEVKHQSETESGPDFWLWFAGRQVGVECVEAVSQEHYRIELLREKKYPNAFNFGRRFHPTDRLYTNEERELIASGQMAGTVWMSGSAERDWLGAMNHFVASKQEKLAKGNYGLSTETWLLIQDEWSTPLHYYPEKTRAAGQLLAASVERSKSSFGVIYIMTTKQLLAIEGGVCRALPLIDLWTKDSEGGQ